MRKIQCGECGRRYDFDVDDFCPKCGAFNLPPRGSRIGANGQVIRADGINENNHKDSFVHQELHREDRVRRRTGLERPKGRTGVRQAWQGERKKRKLPRAVWIVLGILGINFLFRVIASVVQILPMWSAYWEIFGLWEGLRMLY